MGAADAGSNPAAPTPRSRWQCRHGAHGIVRVMGVVEGWVVYRRKGRAPGLRHVNEWHAFYEPVEAFS